MKNLFTKMAWGALLCAAGWLAWQMVAGGAPGLGAVFFALTLFATWVYGSTRTHAIRYLLPGLATFALFIVLPLLYTVFIAFTNFSGPHLLSEPRVREWFAQEWYAPDATRHAFSLFPAAEPEAYRVSIRVEAPEGTRYFTTPPLIPADAQSGQLIRFTHNIVPPQGAPVDLRGIIENRKWLQQARFALPGTAHPLQLVTLRELGARAPLWQDEGGNLRNAQTGRLLVPDSVQGSFVDAETGEAVGPGWRVFVGWENFQQLLSNPRIRRPFLRIFSWNLSFAFLSVFITFVVGVLLACLLQWPALRGRHIYRTLLILPYAIPAFIPILVFRGLFNENFGEINQILRALFGVAPAWFTNPWLARTMILMVNTWLGYPYMMIICAGMLQAVPTDLYEASAMDGATPWHNFRHVTLPQILPPLLPLLIASFAFNFNNFTLIYLLTGGEPAMPGIQTLAGSTDLLVSYTYRIAFRDSSAQMGFASAVATLLFLIVGALAFLQFRATRRKNPAS